MCALISQFQAQLARPAETMSERRTVLAHTTILRSVQRYVPEFEKLWKRYASPVDGPWRCDETYIKAKGHWSYLDHAVDQHGRTVDSLLIGKRDVAATKRFVSRAMKINGPLGVIALDPYTASHRAVAEMKSARSMLHRVGARSNKYVNNVIEQDHRRIKHGAGSMLGLKRFGTAAIAISGMGLAARSGSNRSKSPSCPEDPGRCLRSGRPPWRLDA